MLLVPAIDLKNGHCVRLKQGRFDDITTFGTDPIAIARRWVEAGAKRLHLVDLDGALEGKLVNDGVVRAIAQTYPNLPIQIGGGIRTLESAQAYVDAGVSYVIIGTKAVQDPNFVDVLCKTLPGRVIVGIDAKDGMVATHGWETVSSLRATDLAKRVADSGVSGIVYTDIARDGMMTGVNVEATAQLAEACGIPVFASGGMSSMNDVQALYAQAHRGIAGTIIGRAIYTGDIDLVLAQRWMDTQDASKTN